MINNKLNITNQNPKKVLFIDVDGTLLDNQAKTILPSTYQILEELSQKVDLFLATGRSKTSLKPIADLLPFFKGMILMNGSTVYVDNQLIRFVKFSEADLVNLIESGGDYPLGLLTDDQIYLNYLDDITKYILRDFSIDQIHDLNHAPFPLDINYSSGWIFTDSENIQKINQKLINLRCISWGSFGCDVIYHHESKAKGIELVLETYQYQHANTYAIGDSDNDLEMFKLVNFSICMGNGTPKAKELADYVTDTIASDGFAKALRLFFNNL